MVMVTAIVPAGLMVMMAGLVYLFSERLGLGWPESIVLGVLAVLLFGGRLPDAGRRRGRAFGRLIGERPSH
jgi:hypothetical protein